MTNARDPFDQRQLQPRARDLFARAARMQELHGQAQTQMQAQTDTAAMASTFTAQARGGALHPQTELVHAASHAVISAHGRLQQAAQRAQQLAAADPLLTQLNARIHGAALVEAQTRVNVLDIEPTAEPSKSLPAGPPRLAPPHSR